MIRSETAGRVARIRFDRLDKKNAITAEMYKQLGAALAAAEADPKVRAVLLHGSADCFTAGNDVADLDSPFHLGTVRRKYRGRRYSRPAKEVPPAHMAVIVLAY